MAKKKKKELTIEEMLEEAIVKEEDWPYKVPDNWVWTKLDYIAQYKKGPFGSAVTKAMFVPKSQDAYKVYEQGVAIRKDINYGNYYINPEKYNELKGFKVEPGDLIVSCAGTVGETFQLPDGIEQGIINQALMRVRVKPEVSLKYFLMYFDEILRKDITGKSKGTAIKNIPRFSVLKMMPYPLPPLAEQQRIVDRIESLFDKLDQAKELIQETLDSFENRKSAILHQAFTGVLTKKWREVNGVGMESWVETTLGESGQWYGGGTPSKSKIIYWEKGDIPWVTPKDMKSMLINDTIDHITLDAIAESSAKLIDKPAVLFVVRSGILRRILPIAIAEKSVTVNQDMKAIVPKKANLKYLYWYCVCHEKEIRNTCSKSGTTVESINSQALYKYPFFTPSLEEQQEIIYILDDLFGKEQNAKDLCDLIDQIDVMKKAILGKAFRGELGTNEVGEESVNKQELINLIKNVDK